MCPSTSSRRALPARDSAPPAGDRSLARPAWTAPSNQLDRRRKLSIAGSHPDRSARPTSPQPPRSRRQPPAPAPPRRSPRRDHRGLSPQLRDPAIHQSNRRDHDADHCPRGRRARRSPRYRVTAPGVVCHIAATLQQRAHRVQAGVDVKRRPHARLPLSIPHGIVTPSEASMPSRRRSIAATVVASGSGSTPSTPVR